MRASSPEPVIRRSSSSGADPISGDQASANGRSAARSNRTRTFAQTTAKQLVTWAAPDSVLVFEDLSGIPRPAKGTVGGKALRRRLSLWQRRAIRSAVEHKAQERGLLVTEVNPAYTSKCCSRCGCVGQRHRHSFSCPHCGFTAHADVNAAVNIRTRFAVSRHGGPPSIGPEAQPSGVGKLFASANSH